MGTGGLFDHITRQLPLDERLDKDIISQSQPSQKKERALYAIFLPEQLNTYGRIRRDGSCSGTDAKHALFLYLNRRPHQHHGRLWYSQLQGMEGFPQRFAVVIPDIDGESFPGTIQPWQRQSIRVRLFAEELRSTFPDNSKNFEHYHALAQEIFDRICNDQRAYRNRIPSVVQD